MEANVPPQVMQTVPLEYKNFSGGMTDFYVGAPLHRFERGDNLVIVKHDDDVGKLFTRPGSEILDSTYYQIPAGAQRIGTLKYFETVLFYHSARKFYYVNAGWQTLQGPSSNDVFPAGVDTTTVVSTATWNKHLFVTSSDLVQKVQKIYKDSGGVWRLRTAGMPTLATNPTVTPAGAGTTVSYLYRFLHKYTYTVGTVTYIDRGATVEVLKTGAASPGAGAAKWVVSAIEVLANGATYNYDTGSASLKTEIYRTTNNGQNFFFVGEVSNGTTTFDDTVTDAALLNNEPLYTEGGIPENNEPPLCKVVHVVGTRGIYAHTKEGSEIFSNRFYQSIPGDIDSVPSDYYQDVDQSIVGASSVQNSPVILCDTYIYRVDGVIDELGRGFLDPQRISETAGCLSSSSIVQTIEGIFWAGLDGFYFSDGYQVIRVSKGIRKTYQNLITSDARKRRIVGKYDANENRIVWTTQQASGATDCDSCFVLDLNWGISEDMPLTTFSGDVNFAPTAIEFVGANLVRGDTRGYTFIHRDTLYVDPKIDIAANPSTWATATIFYDYISTATDFGTSYARKYVTGCSVVCKNETNLSLQIRTINDDGRKTGDLKPIRFRGNVVWGDPDIYWGDPDLIWNYQGLIDDSRRMPSQTLRCEYRQTQLTNALVAIVSSDTLGTAAVSGAANTATLTDTVAYDWPAAAIDYYISFESDSYSKNYLITARTNDVLTFADPDATAPTLAAGQWVIRGYPKGEILNLVSYTLAYAIFGDTQNKFKKSGTGEVGAGS